MKGRGRGEELHKNGYTEINKILLFSKDDKKYVFW